MKCEDMEKKILLHESGELSLADADELVRHLESCTDCRSFHDDTARLLSTARKTLSADGPSPRVTAAIMAEARARVTTRTIAIPWRRARAFAYAAALVIAVTGMILFHDRKGPTDDAVADRPSAEIEQERISGVGFLLAIVCEDDVGAEEYVYEQGPQNLYELGRQLMKLEGLDTTEFMQEDDDFLSLPGALQPIGLRRHSVDEHPVKICV